MDALQCLQGYGQQQGQYATNGLPVLVHISIFVGYNMSVKQREKRYDVKGPNKKRKKTGQHSVMARGEYYSV